MAPERDGPGRALRSLVLRGNRFVGAAASSKSARSVSAADAACDHHADQHCRAKQGPKWGRRCRILRFSREGPAAMANRSAAGAFCRAANRSQALPMPPCRAAFRYSCEATCQKWRRCRARHLLSGLAPCLSLSAMKRGPVGEVPTMLHMRLFICRRPREQLRNEN